MFKKCTQFIIFISMLMNFSEAFSCGFGSPPGTCTSKNNPTNHSGSIVIGILDTNIPMNQDCSEITTNSSKVNSALDEIEKGANLNAQHECGNEFSIQQVSPFQTSSECEFVNEQYYLHLSAEANFECL